MHNLAILAAAALAISAVNKGADADGDGKISDTEARAEMSAGGLMTMKAGLWEAKISFDKLEAPEAPEDSEDRLKAEMAKGTTKQSCLTPAQLDQPGADFFGVPEDANCAFDELRRSGDAMKVTMTCELAGNVTTKSAMNGTFAAETYNITIEHRIVGPPMGAIKMTGKIEGKRVGDCPA